MSEQELRERIAELERERNEANRIRFQLHDLVKGYKEDIAELEAEVKSSGAMSTSPKAGAANCPDCALESRGRWCYDHLVQIERELRLRLADCESDLVLCWGRLDRVSGAIEWGVER